MLHAQKPPQNEKCPVWSQNFPIRMFAAHVPACRFEKEDEVSNSTHNTKISDDSCCMKLLLAHACAQQYNLFHSLSCSKDPTTR